MHAVCYSISTTTNGKHLHPLAIKARGCTTLRKEGEERRGDSEEKTEGKERDSEEKTERGHCKREKDNQKRENVSNRGVESEANKHKQKKKRENLRGEMERA